MLSNETHCIKAAESFSWLMMIPYRQYNPAFTISGIDEDDVEHRFEVSMTEIANK
jgi:predicted transcriptional regulator